MILFHFCSAKFVALFTLRNPNLTNLPKFQSDPLSSGWNSLQSSIVCEIHNNWTKFKKFSLTEQYHLILESLLDPNVIVWCFLKYKWMASCYSSLTWTFIEQKSCPYVSDAMLKNWIWKFIRWRFWWSIDLPAKFLRITSQRFNIVNIE